MKKSPQDEHLEDVLRSSSLSACGFMGSDDRGLWEIIEQDLHDCEKHGKTKEKIASRMKYLTDRGQEGLGEWVQVEESVEVRCDDSRGIIPCPWPHHVRCLKRTTTVRRTDTDKSIRWSDLNVHMIKDHGFFEGKGSAFRLEPSLLIDILF